MLLSSLLLLAMSEEKPKTCKSSLKGVACPQGVMRTSSLETQEIDQNTKIVKISRSQSPPLLSGNPKLNHCIGHNHARRTPRWYKIVDESENKARNYRD